ncbi:MAG: hypothetical protein A2284_03250 [Deltaproteobacteria bacterium RIFOXYA12_FULL_61_11]|nr:MAG: hypothetical protein A2284_03250 [Deltaproteobacteria bacterium RIFOXYA12_FULL_61_11]
MQGRRLDLLAGLFAFLLYLLHLPEGLVWFDSAELLAATCQLGLSHPPGQPLLHLFGQVALQMPFGSAAVRLHLFSAAVGGLAMYVLARWLRRLLAPGNREGAVFAPFLAVCCAGLTSIALQGVRFEVYGLALLLNLGALLSYQRILDGETPRGSMRSLLLFLAASSITHLIAFLGLIAALGGQLLLDRATRIRLFRALSGDHEKGWWPLFTLFGLSPVLYLLLRTEKAGILQWQLIEGPTTFLRYLLGGYYAGRLTATDVLDKGQVLLDLMEQNLPLPLMLLLPLALGVLWRVNKGAATLLLGLVILPVVPILALGIVHADNPDLHGYLTLSVIAQAVLLGQLFFLPLRDGGLPRPGRILIAAGGILLGTLLILRSAPNYHFQERDGQDEVADALARHLPPESVLVFRNDDLVFPLFYLQGCLGERRDVLPVGRFLLQYLENYRRLQRAHPRLFPELPPEGAPLPHLAGERAVLGGGFYAWQVERLLRHLPEGISLAVQPDPQLELQRPAFEPRGFVLEYRADQRPNRALLASLRRMLHPSNGYLRHAQREVFYRDALALTLEEPDALIQEALFDELDRLWGPDAELLVGRGFSLLGQGKPIEAEEVLSEALRLDPDNLAAARSLAVLRSGKRR